MWPEIFSFLPRASTIAGPVDQVFWYINAITIFFTILVAVLVIAFTVRYRKGNRVNRTLPGHEGIALELTWTIIPLIIALSIFAWSTSVYFSIIRPPKDAMEIYVVGKQWMWKMQHPNGRWEMNEIHVPLGRPVKLTMISEDVVHSFGIPAFRVKQDVIPGRYTQLWFEPTRVGRYHLFCSQFCGTNHAIMGGYITVMEPQEWERWMRTGNTPRSLASTGERKFRELGCTGCHGGNSTVRAPSLENIYNQPVAVQLPDQGNRTVTIKADDRYIHDSIVLPAKEIAAGYSPIMPSYKGRLSEEELIQLVEYIKSLSTSNGTSNSSAQAYNLRGDVAPKGLVQSGAVSPLQGGSSTGAVNGSASGSMANTFDREAVFDRKGLSQSGEINRGNTNQSGDMSDWVGRKAILRGGGADVPQASAERGRFEDKRDRDLSKGLNPYNSDNFVRDKARAISGLNPSGSVDGKVSTQGSGANSASGSAGRTGR
jgi:cytochrome c oxidase subunit II